MFLLIVFIVILYTIAKHHRVSFPLSNTKPFHPFFLVHTDVWGSSKIPNITGAKWFVSFIDDCTKTIWLFLMKEKFEVSHIFFIFYKIIKTQFGVPIKRFRSDNARDYFNLTLSTFLQNEGIIYQSSCVDTSQQNGVAEWKNRHLCHSSPLISVQCS